MYPAPAFPPDDGHDCRGCANAANAEAGPPWRARRRVASSPQVPIFVVVSGPYEGRLACLHAAYPAEAGVSVVASVGFNRIETDPLPAAAWALPAGFHDPRKPAAHDGGMPHRARRHTVPTCIGHGRTWPCLA